MKKATESGAFVHGRAGRTALRTEFGEFRYLTGWRCELGQKFKAHIVIDERFELFLFDKPRMIQKSRRMSPMQRSGLPIPHILFAKSLKKSLDHKSSSLESGRKTRTSSAACLKSTASKRSSNSRCNRSPVIVSPSQCPDCRILASR